MRENTDQNNSKYGHFLRSDRKRSRHSKAYHPSPNYRLSPDSYITVQNPKYIDKFLFGKPINVTSVFFFFFMDFIVDPKS